MSGAVALVADKDRVLDVEAVGLASLKSQTPMPKDGLFWIASMTKSITGTLFMMLVDEGKVKIEEPVEKYLPEFKGQQVVEVGPADKVHPNGVPTGLPPHAPAHPITIREVLSHTSGICLPNDPALKRNYRLDDDVAQYARLPLRREPGAKYEYNNAGINTAARIIEVVSGMPYAQFLQVRLLDPLGMKDTGFWPDAVRAKRLAHSARMSADKSGLEEIEFDKNVTPELIARLGKGVDVPREMIQDLGVGKVAEYANHYGEPAGGLMSTAADMGQFCRMLLCGGELDGRRYLSEAAVRAMTMDQTGSATVSPQEGYGLGWSVKKGTEEGPSIGSFGHRGARRTVMWIDPANGLAMVLLLERMDMSGDEQKDVYGSFLKAAISRWGKKQN